MKTNIWTTITKILDSAIILQYSPDKKDEYRELSLIAKNEDFHYFNKIVTWGEKFKEQDMNRLKESGFKIEDFQMIEKHLTQLKKTFIYTERGNPFEFALPLQEILYKYEQDNYTKIYAELTNIKDECPNCTDEYIIETEIETGIKVLIPNPYYYLQDFLSEFIQIIAKIDAIDEKIPYKNMVFAKSFKCVPDFLEEFENFDFDAINLDQDDGVFLLQTIRFLILKLYGYNVIKLKLNSYQTLEWGKLSFHPDVFANFNLYEELYDKFYSIDGELNEQKIEEIHKIFESKDGGEFFKKLTSTIIPNYKKLQNTDRLLIINSEYLDLGFEYFFFENYLPYKLIDCPDDSYKILFKNLLTIIHRNLSENKNICPYLHSIKLKDISDISTLNQQKYYIINLLFNFFITSKPYEKSDHIIYNKDFCFLFLIFPWKFDSQIQQARNVEKYYHSICFSNEYDVIFFKEYSKFIHNEVLYAQQPLDQDYLRKRMGKFTSKEMNQSTCSACCNIQ